MRARVIITGLLLAFVAVAADLMLLRSFAFIDAPGFFAPVAAVGLPAGAWPPAGAELRVPASVSPAALAIPRLALASTPSAEAATIVIMDGMRLDRSRELPGLNRLRQQGQEAVLRVDFPSFSRVGYAGILTGAPPLVHGYTSNRRKSASDVPSIMHVARACGLRTRIWSEHHTWIQEMFAGAFDEVRPLEERIATPSAARLDAPHLDVVYISEPDLTAHEFGGASPEYARKALEVDEIVGKVAAGIDLSREALWVATDHGHLDRGGHGGTEDVVMSVPCIAAGKGASIAGAASLRDIAPRVARCLGLPPLPGAAAKPPADDQGARVMRLCAAFLAIYLLARLLGGAEGPRPRDLACAFGSVGLFVALYWLRGFPFSFSIANKGSEVPRLMAEILAMAAVSIYAGARLSRGGPRFAAAVLRTGTVALAFAIAMAGPTATSAIYAPQAAWLVHLAASFVTAAGLIAPLLVRVVKNHAEMAEE